MKLTLCTTLRDGALVVILSAALALALNLLRSTNSIALVASKPYDILVPCPEFQGKPARPMDPKALPRDLEGVALVDARDKEDFDRWHLPRAISIPFDYLEPNPEEKRVLRTQARQIIVYGDGDDPDSGKQLANAISGKGVKNVHYVEGGAPALKKAGK